MGFANNKLAKIWELKAKDKYYEVKISTSKKDKANDRYEQDFSSFVRFIGKAADKAKDLKGDEMIKLIEVETSNKYDNENKKVYYNFVVWDFELYNKDGKSKADDDNPPPAPPSDDDLGLPF